MGAGRKTETAVQQNKPPSLWRPNTYPATARNLRKADLAGVIFGCKHSTFKECIFKQLFGLPVQHFQYVQNVTQGMPLFLFNYSDRKLHGVFEALSSGQMNINPHAWTLDGQEMTPFPAQVRVKIRMQCQPLNEDQFGPILADNYRPHEPTHFLFELDKAQTEKLISLFSASPFRQRLATPVPARKWGNLFGQSIAAVAHKADCNSRTTNLDEQLGSALSSAEVDKRIQKSEAASDQDATAPQVNISASFKEKTWISLFNSQFDSILNKDPDSMDEELEVHVPHQDPFSLLGQSSCPQLSAKKETAATEVLVNIGSAHEIDKFFCLIENPESGELVDTENAVTLLIESAESVELADTEIATASLNLNGDDSLLAYTVNSGALTVNEGEDTETTVSDANLSHESNIDWNSSFELPHVPLNAIAVEEQYMVPKPCSEGSMFSIISGAVPLEDNVFTDTNIIVEAKAGATLIPEEMISKMKASDVEIVVRKLIQIIGDLKSFQLSQIRKIQNLEEELVESKKKIRDPQYHCGKYGPPVPSFINGHVQGRNFERTFQNLGHSILLLGGFNGSSWLPDLVSYSPYQDMMHFLEPMSLVRSYASAVALNDELYVLGGRYDASWYDTVESYNLKSHQWITCPSLNKKKGSLAGVCLRDKIFAIGGGNATDCFSEVEMLDRDIGKWIFTRSMVRKRFAPAAVQLNGAIYVAGGYDGQEYLKSMERLDLRECSWTLLRTMTTRRGCHALTVLNEKLYAIGGYDGTQMIPTVEVFEPRVGLWMTLEPMTYARGYAAAVTLGNTICVMGGMQGNEVLDTVECYSEGNGWQLMDLKSMGKRCCFSAIVV